jgi:RsiW-degrading membrane proteinase PrsW (M82 family)
MAVVLCGMASGAGFASFENVFYVRTMRQAAKECWKIDAPDSCKDPIVFGLSGKWYVAARIVSAGLHVCLTGTTAVALAYEWFLAPNMWILKYLALIAMMILHGCFNASTQWATGEDNSINFQLLIITYVQFFVAWCFALFYIEPEFQRRRAAQVARSAEAGGDLALADRQEP